jgi:5'-deoxynucleotidase YfbR-like HD superfamily hydrolase
MIVSDNTLLNILLPKDNKTLKNVLKESDNKSLQQMVQNKSLPTNEILKNLFNEIKDGNKSNTAIQNMVKNSSLFKNLGSFSNSASTLLNQINKDTSLQKFKPLLESFLKNIKSLDQNSLKDQLSKSGVFLESKILKNSTGSSSIPKSLDTLLTQIKTLLQKVNTPQVKQINDLITKLTQAPTQTNQQQTLKSLVSLLQNISTTLSDKGTQSLSNLTNQLSSLVNKASITESKLENSMTKPAQVLNDKEQINNQTKQLVTQIKNEVLNNTSTNTNKPLLTQLENILKSNDLFIKNDKLIEPKILLNNLLNSNEMKTASVQNKNIANLSLNLQNISNNIETLESKALNLVNIKNEANSLTGELKQNLSSLKLELQNIPSLDLKNINPIISKLESLQSLFAKVENPIGQTQNITEGNKLNFSNNFSNNISSLIVTLKENISNLSTNQNNQNLQNTVLKVIDKLEVIIQTAVRNEGTSINNDMKTMLLQMQDELATKTDVKSQEVFKQIDKMLTQIEYHQLVSYTNNSNFVYVPFLWDMLEDGTIDMKKTDEDKFYCQIHLTLKDFGKVDLMLALYDTNKLDLTIQTQREHFKNTLRDNMQKLKVALNDVGLIPVNVKLLDLNEDNKKDEITEKTQAFVNPYDQTLQPGIDIRA